MNTLHRIALCGLIAVLPSFTAAADLDRHRQEIVAAMRAGDVAALTRHHAARIRVMPEYHPTLFGADATRDYFTAFFARFRVTHYARASLQVLDLGDRVVEVGTFDLRLEHRSSSGVPIDLHGKYRDLWEGADDRRSLATHAWNFDRWPASQDDLRFPTVAGRRTAFDARVPITDSLSFELAALNRMLESTVQQRDGNAWGHFFAADAIMLPNHHAAVRGRAAIDEFVATHSRGLPIFEKLDIRNDEIVRAGDFVIDYASHVANWRNDAGSGVNTGKNVRVWRREPAGRLVMVLQLGSYD